LIVIRNNNTLFPYLLNLATMDIKTLYLKDANFRENNFDFLRFLAASLVIFYHTFPLYGSYPVSKVLGFLNSLPLPIFFIISGFLITKSWINNPNLITFFQKRILRIFPALIAVVIFSILVIGPIIIGSHGDIRSYFSNPETWQYAQNIIMRSRFYLPGVFEGNIYKGVINGSLWTLPIEFWLYIFLSFLGFVKILEKKRIISVVIVLAMFFLHRSLSVRPDALELSFLSLPVVLTLKFGIFFYVGSASYLFKEKIILNTLVFIIALIILYHYNDDLALYLTLPYIILYFAFAIDSKILKNWGKFGDFSYGLYVFAFPVQQMIMHYLGKNISLPIFFITAYLTTLSLAIISWNLIEKPALRLKKLNIMSSLVSLPGRMLKRNIAKAPG